MKEFLLWAGLLIVIVAVASVLTALSTYQSYEPVSDVVCFHQYQRMSCMPRSQTALTVEQALDLRRP